MKHCGVVMKKFAGGIILAFLIVGAAEIFAQENKEMQGAAAGKPEATELPWLTPKKQAKRAKQEAPKPTTPDLVVECAPGQYDLPEAKQIELEALTHALLENAAQRATVKSYAAGATKEDAAARQIAMKRALAVRDFLASQGIQREQLILKVFGNAAPEAPFDRMEFTLEKAEEKKP